ncbi:hypothetical protein, partial [Cutibacterium avidum]|uniref:hypothetical protein n=1 Tax=Cutibacterium avidum TaxID=33010 RepID=UPI002FF2E86D
HQKSLTIKDTLLSSQASHATRSSPPGNPWGTRPTLPKKTHQVKLSQPTPSNPKALPDQPSPHGDFCYFTNPNSSNQIEEFILAPEARHFRYTENNSPRPKPPCSSSADSTH